MTDNVFTAQALTKSYTSGEVEVQARRGLDLEIAGGEAVVLLGPSGSGKSTLLDIMGGLDHATSGRLRQDRFDRRLCIGAPCRWLVLLLVLAFAASGLLHVSGSGHAADAATHAHDLASASQNPAGGDPCCHEDVGQSHGPVCNTATGCALCVPIVSAGVLLQAGTVGAEMEPTDDHSGRIQTPQLRPPKAPASA